MYPRGPMLVVSEEVKQALAKGNVVALESTIITHGMPYPQNLETALLVEETVRQNGSVPATIAIIDGVIKVGLSRDELEALAKSTTAIKVSRRDIAHAVAGKKTGSTTVSATMIFAHMAGVRIFATGGIGGVHRGAESSFDISADITELARTPVLVVCAGAKSILDLPKTVELLETGGVSVIGFKTNEFPAFFTPKSGLPTSARCDSEQAVADLLKTHSALRLTSGLILACPVPEDQAGDVKQIEQATAAALVASKSVVGKDVTPFMLKFINEQTKGASLKANIALIRNNAAIASRVANRLHSPQTPVSNVQASPVSSMQLQSTGFGKMAAIPVSPKIVVVGGIGMDTIAVPEDQELIGETKTSSPGSIRSSVGGVCRNVATAIHQLGGDVSFYSAVGTDTGSAAHSAVTAEAQRQPWINLQTSQGRTAQYTAVMNGDGSLLAGVADMSIFDDFAPQVPLASSTKLVIVSSNLSERTISRLCVGARDRSIPVWADCVSVAKAPKLLNALHNITLVKANIDELASLAAILPPEDLEHESLSQWVCSAVKSCMHQNGGDVFLVTCGPRGIFLAHGKNDLAQPKVVLPDGAVVEVSPIAGDIEDELRVTFFSLPAVNDIIDSTGAGDSLLGATAWAHIEARLPLVSAVIVGIAAARLTLRSTQPVAPEIGRQLMQPLVDSLAQPLRAKL